MKSLLLQFLKGQVELIYPRVETRVVSIEPLQLTDDFISHFELDGDQKLKSDLKKNQDSPNLKLLLCDWEFCIKKPPFGSPRPEVLVKTYKIIPSTKVMVPGPLKTTDVLQDDVVKFLVNNISKPATPVQKGTAIASIAKTEETGLLMSTGKKRTPSPLPIQIEMVPDNYEPIADHPELPDKLSIKDLLCFSLPARKKNWRLAIAKQVQEEAASIKHVSLSSSKASKKLVSTACPSANLAEEDSSLGKRKICTNEQISLADLRQGIELGLIKWHHLTFSGLVVDELKNRFKTTRKGRIDLVTLKCEAL